MFEAGVDLSHRNQQGTYFLLPLLKVEKHQFVICKAALSESQADTIGVCRTASTIQNKSWHLPAV